jgi:hypothetical protein
MNEEGLNPMPSNPLDDQLLRSYLLGELSEEEADRLERTLMEDDELFELCEAVEADLLAACDRGELTAADKEQVRRRLASSPAGQRRFALARSLNTAAREPQRITAPPLPFRHRVPLPRRVHHWAALAAAVLLVAVGAWFALSTLQRGGPPQMANKIPTPAKRAGTAAPGRPEAPAAKAPVAPHPRTEPAQPPQRDERAAAKPPERPAPVKAFLTLSLATLRGDEDIQQFRIPPDAELIEIQIDLEGLEDFRSFHAAVRSLENEQRNETVWEKGGLAPQRLDWGTALVLEVPAPRLTAGRYEVGVTAGTEELTKEFEVVREYR